MLFIHVMILRKCVIDLGIVATVRRFIGLWDGYLPYRYGIEQYKIYYLNKLNC